MSTDLASKSAPLASRRKRRALVRLCGFFLVLCAVTWLSSPKCSMPHAEQRFPSELALERRIPELWMEDVPLSEAIEKWSRQVGERIVPSSNLPVTIPVTIRLRNATLPEIAQEIGGGIVGIEFVATPEHIVATGRYSRDAASHVVREYDVGDLLARSTTPIPKAMINYVERTRWPGGNLLQPNRQNVAQMIWNDWQRQPYEASFIGERLVVRDTLAGQREFRQLLNDLRAGKIEFTPRASVPRDPNTLRWDTQLKGWYSISYEKCLEHLNKVVAEFEVENVSVEVALWALFSKADVPYIINKGDQDQQDILRCPTTVFVKNLTVQSICSQILIGTAMYRDPPWADGSLSFELRDEVVRLGLSKHRVFIVPSGTSP